MESSLKGTTMPKESAGLEQTKFLAIASHEIRTPMNGILGFARLLVEVPLSLRDQDYVHTIINNIEAALRIADDILDFTCMEAGTFRIENRSFLVRSVIEGVRRLLALQAGQKGIFLKTEVAPDVPEKLVGDAGRLRQVLINLVGNAIKFTDEGHVVMKAALNSTHVLFSVEDTGIGIPFEKLETIFHPFNGCQKNGGKGLGLAISKRLVELMGGSLRVDSEMGLGSCFSFELSLKQTWAGKSQIDV